MKIKRICQQCGREFEIVHCRIKKWNDKFCSKKCYGSHSHLNRIERTCEWCGKKFEVTSSQLKQGGKKFCSTKCYGKWQSENRKGENHPSWKGGISFEPYCTKFNNNFRKYIREKFGRICFLCQKTEEENGQRLSVHHVNYDNDCMCNDNLTCQFVPLCRSCNSKVNANRDMWEQKIKDKMQNKLNGWYI